MTVTLKDDAYKQLKSEIDDRGIKTKFIANKIGISSSYLGQVLNGSRPLSMNVAVNVSQALGVPLSIFLNQS
ncbi:helix-turn-helix domain-containing protein [Limosilactobacillus oris]|uniref:helix-turn-helix domain-containing protein n=1 Tax=Limosilactobacillus oris TaxID=1632 RepID=UPI00242B59B7|nr:helix-turn-helix transcriptional regulator [Limosilactobacillus oris]